MKNRSLPRTGSPLLMGSTILAIAATTLLTIAAGPFAAMKRARMMEAMNNARQVKLACDGFAIDFDGQYPNDDTAEKVIEGGLPNKSANDYFTQLFLAGAVESERIFWVKRASVCAKLKPDDVIAKRGKLVPEGILEPGDCGWAYMRDQTNTSNPSRPFLLEAYQAGTADFDRKLHDEKVIVVSIDGAARALPLNAKGKIVDAKGVDLLTAKGAPWDGSGEDPAKLLVQPAAAPAPKPKPGAAEGGATPKPE